MSEHVKKIAIVGAGGQVGSHIVSALKASPILFDITAITRVGSSSTMPAGVAIARIDYNDQESIVKALAGHDVLIITLDAMAPPEISNHLVRAAATANVKWIIPNEWSYDDTRMTDQAAAETFIAGPKKAQRKLVEELGVSSWIAVACGFWYEIVVASADGSLGRTKPRNVLFYNNSASGSGEANAGNVRLSVSTLRQTGKAVAALLSLPVTRTGGDSGNGLATLSDFANKHVHSASTTVSQRDIWASLQRVTGTKPQDWTVKTADAEQLYHRSAAKVMAAFSHPDGPQKPPMSDFGTAMYTRLYFPDEIGNTAAQPGGLDNSRIGLPEEDLDTITEEAVGQLEYFAERYSAMGM